MSIIEQALFSWRRARRNVSEHRETNIEAWLVQLENTLAEHGLSQSEISAYLDDSLRGFVEKDMREGSGDASSAPGGKTSSAPPN